MAGVLTKTTKRSQALGAPAQHSQSTRKGKKAWRKNIDLDDVATGLEEITTVEIVTGCVLNIFLTSELRLRLSYRSSVHKKADNELFQVDLTGDTKG